MVCFICCLLFSRPLLCFFLLFFFFNDTATTEIYTLSLHDALPISYDRRASWSLRQWFPLCGRPRQACIRFLRSSFRSRAGVLVSRGSPQTRTSCASPRCRTRASRRERYPCRFRLPPCTSGVY